MIDINSAQVLSRLRAIVGIIGESYLGFKESEVGLHSIRSGGAMAMFLSGISTIIIRRVGRWSSEAFLEYIREQVEAFTFGVSKKMLHYEHFHTLNEDKSSLLLEEELEDILIENKCDGKVPVPIDHELNFSSFSLQPSLVPFC